MFACLNDRELVLNTAMDKAMLALQSMADEMERERARQRTYDALERKARQGFVTGGRVFGYDNVEVKTGGKRSHVERRINEDEAQVVRRVFELDAGGVGFKGIAVRLNDEGARCPRPQRGRPAGWSPSSIREALKRYTYVGRAVWNTTRKRNGWGQINQMPRPESEWLAAEVDGLRIIPDSLWTAVQERLAAAAKRSGKRGGRPPASGGKYLLTGLLQCGRCGAGMEVVSAKNGTTRKFRWLLSLSSQGAAICGNSLVMDVQRIDLAMVDALESMLLREAVLENAVEQAVSALRGDASANDVERLTGRIATLDQEISRLVELAAQGQGAAAIGEAIRKRDAERAGLSQRLRELKEPPLDREGFRSELMAMLPEYQQLLTRNVPEARDLLRVLIHQRFIATPMANERAYELRGVGNLSHLVARVSSQNFQSRWGRHPIFGPFRRHG